MTPHLEELYSHEYTNRGGRIRGHVTHVAFIVSIMFIKPVTPLLGESYGQEEYINTGRRIRGGTAYTIHISSIPFIRPMALHLEEFGGQESTSTALIIFIMSIVTDGLSDKT